MTVHSRTAMGVAALVAGGLHLGGFWAIYQPMTVQIAASGAASEIKQGNAFADMATGVMTALKTTQVTSVPETAPPTDPVPPKTAAQVDVSAEASKPNAQAAPTTTPTSVKAASPVATPYVAVIPGVTATVSMPQTTAIATQTTATALQPTTTAAEPVTTTTAITGEALDPSAVLVSKRPVVRPEGLAPPPKPVPARQTQATRGNASQNTTAGRQTNTNRQATATTSGSNAQTAAPAPRANAQAVSNYPGQVMQRISRVRKPRTNARGSAYVSFSINGRGGLAGLSIGRSSGNAQLDQMALTVVQRAAPFPAPPAGATTRFTVEISGR